MAMKRLLSIEKKMDRDPKFAEGYTKLMNHFLEKGHASKAAQSDFENSNGKLWFLPHFGVTNLNKPGKLR
ncbi:unnamed protein product, partial [Allacma fusca]